jgi:regulator of sigma E protease
VVLAFMNILPIPGLDGGHAIFASIELITRRKVSDKVLQHAQTIGMFILILLMVFVIGNDIFKLFR